MPVAEAEADADVEDLLPLAPTPGLARVDLVGVDVDDEESPEMPPNS